MGGIFQPGAAGVPPLPSSGIGGGILFYSTNPLNGLSVATDGASSAAYNAVEIDDTNPSNGYTLRVHQGIDGPEDNDISLQAISNIAELIVSSDVDSVGDAKITSNANMLADVPSSSTVWRINDGDFDMHAHVSTRDTAHEHQQRQPFV